MQYDGPEGNKYSLLLLLKGRGIGCEILRKMSKNAGYPPNNLVKIDFYSRKSKFKILIYKNFSS